MNNPVPFFSVEDRRIAPRGVLLAACFATFSLLPGCGKKAGPPPTPPPAEVSTITIAPESVAVTSELPGRLEAVRVAEVRARVSGILLKKVFTEGSDVKEGDVLFQIDPAPLRAAASRAKAAVARAEATLRQTGAQEARFRKLLSSNATSKQEYDNAAAGADVARADLLSAQAALETAELNLGYATVTAPISGYIGKAAVTEGALVGQNEVTKLAVIQELDTIYFDFTQSSTDWLRLQRALREGTVKGLKEGEANLVLLLEDGSVYAHKGRLLFSDVTVDESTGNVTLRAEFPNPERILLPGMFARVKLEQAVNSAALTIPQRALTRGLAGASTVFLVTPENKIELRTVQTGRAVGDKWIVTSGLAAGDRIVVEGQQKVRPGAEVKPVPFTEPGGGGVATASKKASQQAN